MAIKKKPARKKGRMPAELLERFKGKAGTRKGKDKPVSAGEVKKGREMSKDELAKLKKGDFSSAAAKRKERAAKRAEKRKTRSPKKSKDGMQYAGGSKTFNESTGRHERPDGTPMKRKNARMERQKDKAPQATPYRGPAPKNGGTIETRRKKPTSIKGGSGGNGTYKKPTPSASKPAPKRSAAKKAAPKRSTQKRRVAKKRRSQKK